MADSSGAEVGLRHVLLRLPAELGALGAVPAQEVAGADVRQPEVIGEARGLVPPAPLAAPQDQVQFAHGTAEG